MRKIILAMAALLLLCGCSNETTSEIPESKSTAATAEVTTASETETVTTTSVTTVTTTETTTVPTETTTEKTTTVTEAKPKPPEAVLPAEAIKIDIDIDSGQKYTAQLEILDKENILVIYQFEDEDNNIISAEAKIFGVSDGEEKLHIKPLRDKVDGYLVKDALWYRKQRGHDEDVYFVIYSYVFDDELNHNYGKSETIVYTDYTYESHKYENGVSFYPKFIDLGGKHIIKETAYCNFYDCESGKILLNAIFEGYDSKDDLRYYYEFPIDENRFVYSMWGYEWCWGFGIYDFTTGTANDVPGVHDYRPIGYRNGKIYSYYCEHDGSTDNILYVTDADNLETTPLFDISSFNELWGPAMTPGGDFLLFRERDFDTDSLNIYLYDPDTLEFLKKYTFGNTNLYTNDIRFIDDTRVLIQPYNKNEVYILDLNK